MKRIIFYAGVSIIAACFIGVFAALFWLLSSTIMTKIFEAEFSVFATLLFLFLYVLLLFILAVFMLFSTCFFIYQANIRYKKHTRSFTLLQPDLTGGRNEPAFPLAPYFAGGLPGFGYFAPGLALPFAYYGGLFIPKQNQVPHTDPEKSAPYGKGPTGNKPHFTLVNRDKASPGDLSKESHEVPAPALSAGKDNNILPFPRAQKNHRKQ
jgi:hypothetical protein